MLDLSSQILAMDDEIYVESKRGPSHIIVFEGRHTNGILLDLKFINMNDMASKFVDGTNLIGMNQIRLIRFGDRAIATGSVKSTIPQIDITMVPDRQPDIERIIRLT
jgi:hypothetical protein